MLVMNAIPIEVILECNKDVYDFIYCSFLILDTKQKITIEGNVPEKQRIM